MQKFKCNLITWEYARELSERLAEKIQNSKFEPDIIIALARGGLVPAMNLSDFLEVKDLISMRVEHWEITANRDKKARIKYGLGDLDLSGRKVLVADDIADTGDSLMLSKDYLANFNPEELKIATLHYVKTSKVKPDFYAEVVDRSKEWIWVIYPWNFIEDVSSLIVKSGIGKEERINAEMVKKSLEKEYNLSITVKEIKNVLNWR